MDVRIHPQQLSGSIPAIASKSVAHRVLVCAALSASTTDVDCATSSVDIDATAGCLRSLGIGVARTKRGFRVVLRPDPETGLPRVNREALLDCGESGSTLRFLMPVVGALACDARLTGHGRLAQRPLSPLYEEMLAAGCEMSEPGFFPLEVGGHMRPGIFELPGNVSSQYVSGLLLAAPLMDGATEIWVENPVQSRPYITLTINALRQFGVEVEERQALRGDVRCTVFRVEADARYVSPGVAAVEGDWSNAAFWLAAGAIGSNPVAVSGLNLMSPQGDRAILAALARFGARVSRQGGMAAARRDRLQGCTLDVRDFPDLVPPLAVVAAFAEGTTRLAHAERLRLKESDRLESVTQCLRSLGADARVEGDDLVIVGSPELPGGTVDAANDHRIAMAAAIAATRCTGTVTIRDAECVAKSYPGFFEDYAQLGGSVEQEG